MIENKKDSSETKKFNQVVQHNFHIFYTNMYKCHKKVIRLALNFNMYWSILPIKI